MKIEKLKKAAESAISKANKISTEVNGSWTYRRQRFADSAQSKKETLLSRARVLNRLFDEWSNDTIPDILKNIASAADIDFALYTGYPTPPDKDTPKDGWYRKEYPKKLKTATRLQLISEANAKKIKALLHEYADKQDSSEEIKAKELAAELKKIRMDDIPGFFPTPDKLIELMVSKAEIESHHSILEPSAGIGSIVDYLIENKISDPFNISCCEYNYSLANILQLKGYKVISNDIFDAVIPSDALGKNKGFDRIIMNPPFEKNQDIQHVMYCFEKLLKQGGILVSVMSAGITYNSKLQYFRDFIMKNHGTIIINGQEFKKAFNPTGVSTVTVILKKL